VFHPLVPGEHAEVGERGTSTGAEYVIVFLYRFHPLAKTAT
jgi:hypothetical protein